MPNRILRDWTDSDKINGISIYAERFFTRLIMKADDYGCFYADTRLLKANLFPLLLDGVREADISRWMAECQKAGLIVLYEASGKKYLQIKEFRQRLDKAKAKFPLPTSGKSISDSIETPPNGNEFPAETEAEAETETESETEKKLTPNGVGEAGASPPGTLQVYKQVEKNKKAICDFIKAYKPDFIEPYADLWNLFAKEKGLPQVTKISDKRRRKFKVRVKETAFDFLYILKKAGQSEFLLTGKWFGFDWIMKNEENYLKVIEGNYDKKQEVDQKTGGQGKDDKQAQKTFDETIRYLYGRYQEGQLDMRLIQPEYYDKLVIRNVIPAGTSDKMPGATIEEKKVQAVIELFKQKSNVEQKAPAEVGQ